MKKAPKSFEEALARLETLTQSMQAAKCRWKTLWQPIRKATSWSDTAKTKLAEVEQKLQVLDAGELKELNLEPGE